MNKHNLKMITPTHSPLSCPGCGEMYNYFFHPAATIAFCPDADLDTLSNMVDKVNIEKPLNTRVDVSCKS